MRGFGDAGPRAPTTLARALQWLRARENTMIRRLTLLFVLAGIATARAQFTIAAAANVKPAMEEIKTAFEKANGTPVRVVYGASGKFATQIRNGAPFDVFVSADVSFPDSVVKWGQGVGKPLVYARGLVVLWTSVAELDPAKGPSILLDPRIVKVAVADPKVAPYGREAMKAIATTGLSDKIRPKIVWGENLAQATQYAATGVVEAAFTGKSFALEQFATKGRWAELDSTLVEPIDQAAVVLKYGQDNNPKIAKAFVAFLATPVAKAAWVKYGYKLP